MENSTGYETCCVALSEATRHLLRGAFRLEPLGPVICKGKKHPISCYLLDLGDGGNPQILLGARESQQAAVAWGTPLGLTAAGLAPLYQSGRYFRLRASMPAGDIWTNMQGIDDLDVRRAGAQ